MSTCKVCSRSVRKTVLAMILRGGKLKGARVCQDCKSNLGVTIVVAREAPHCKCGNPATKCHACAGSGKRAPDDALKILRGQLAALKRALPPGVREDTNPFIGGKIEAYEGVIALLEGKAA